MGARRTPLLPALLEAIGCEAQAHGLDAALLEAMVRVESGGDPFAWNPEPHYRYLVDARTGRLFRTLTQAERESETPPRDFPRMPGLAADVDAEWWGQQASWGPLQVMGAVARELGFARHFPALCDPAVGVRYGALHLANLRRRFGKRGLSAVVAAYNAGSPRMSGGQYVNQAYVDKVAALMTPR